MVEGPDGMLLVQNRRRNGMVDWSTPGGVIDAGETLVDGLTREVFEETGLQVRDWCGPVYEVRAEAPDLGWRLRVETHLAVSYDGELMVDDPDGIVVDACFAQGGDCSARLAGSPRWVQEPLTDWLHHRWDGTRTYAYRVDGADLASLSVVRL